MFSLQPTAPHSDSTIDGCDDGLCATDGMPLTADAPLQRGELAKSANRVGSRSCDPELAVRQLIYRIADS